MDTIKRERKNWFYSYNMIFDQPISEHAKLVYLYLCRCADIDGRSFPSRKNIASKCGIKSVRTIDSALAELEKIGLLVKLLRVHESGGNSSNLYEICDTPRAGDALPPVQEMHPPRAGDAPKGLLSEVLPSEVLPSESECKKNARTHIRNEYGEYGKVILSADEHKKLINKYGEAKMQEYIRQLDLRIASEGKHYANHCATIEIWIKKDEKKKTDIQSTAVKRNRFNNFEGRKRDYAEIERLEREQLQADIKKIRPADASTPEQA